MSFPTVPFFRTPWNYDTAAASDSHASVPVGESLTVQSMADDADINVLMRRYGITGKMPDNPRVPSFGDFRGVTDFRTALEAVMEAEEMFMEYPADLRARFLNDPQKLLEFCSDDKNREEAQKLGLLKPKLAEPPPAKVEVVNPTPPPAAKPPANSGTSTV